MERIDFHDQISRNKLKSFFLMAVIFSVIVLFGYVVSLAFEPGFFFVIMSISIFISMSYLLISYYNSGKIAIASVGAKEASRKDCRQFYDLVEGLTIASGLPMPKLYVMDSQQINAFASGRNPENAVVCVTTGALEKLDKRELEGVLSHELSHVANYDIRYMTLVAVMVGMIAIASEIFLRSLWFRNSDDDKNFAFIILGIILAILAPIVVQLVQMAISRKREFAADASGVKFTRYPQGLIGALKKIQKENSPNFQVSSREKENYAERKISKAVAPLFFSNPLKNLASTHPPLDERIRILENM